MGTVPLSPTSRSSPRHVPSDRTVGSAVVAYRAWDQPSSRSRMRTGSPVREVVTAPWRCRASLAHTTYSPDGSSTATGSGVASSTRVNSWARRVSSISSETSTTVRRAPVPPEESEVMGVVDRSTQRVAPSAARNRSRPRSAVPSSSERARSARKSTRPSGSMSAAQPSPRASSAGWPVVDSQWAFTRTARPVSSNLAAPVGAASTRLSRTPGVGESDVGGAGSSVTCGRGDSNPHASRRRLLKPVRLPVPPRPRH